MQSGLLRTDASEIPHHELIASRNSAQQATPGKLNQDFSRKAIQLRGQIFNRTLHEESVGEAAFNRPSINFFGDFLEGAAIRIDTDKKSTRVGLRALVDKQTVSGPNIYSYLSVVISN